MPKGNAVGTLIRTYAAKAPVCVCQPRTTGGCSGPDWCGPQKQAHRAKTLLEGMGVQLPPGIDAALSHALDVGEGRGEFDDIINKWMRERGTDVR